MPEVVWVVLDCRVVVGREAALEQRVDSELAMLAPSEWVEVNRLRRALLVGVDPHNAPTNLIAHLIGRLIHFELFSVGFKASFAGIPAWFVTASVYCRLCLCAQGLM